jgi:hypothetical protein
MYLTNFLEGESGLLFAVGEVKCESRLHVKVAVSNYLRAVVKNADRHVISV